MISNDPLNAARALALGLRKLGLEAQDIGRALLPEASSSTRNRTGQRLLDGAHDPLLSRLADMSDKLGLRFVIEPKGVRVEKL